MSPRLRTDLPGRDALSGAGRLLVHDAELSADFRPGRLLGPYRGGFGAGDAGPRAGAGGPRAERRAQALPRDGEAVQFLLRACSGAASHRRRRRRTEHLRGAAAAPVAGAAHVRRRAGRGADRPDRRGDLHGLRRICGPACQFGLPELDLLGRLRFRFRALPVVPQLHVFHPPRFAGLARRGRRGDEPPHPCLLRFGGGRRAADLRPRHLLRPRHPLRLPDQGQPPDDRHPAGRRRAGHRHRLDQLRQFRLGAGPRTDETHQFAEDSGRRRPVAAPLAAGRVRRRRVCRLPRGALPRRLSGRHALRRVCRCRHVLRGEPAARGVVRAGRAGRGVIWSPEEVKA